MQVAAGVIGQPPLDSDRAFQINVTAQGRLMMPEEFEKIIVKTGQDGRVVYLGDVARVELGAQDYLVNSYLDGKPAVAMVIQQRPGSNALATAEWVRERMRELSEDFPKGLEYRVVYDPTVFIDESVNAVIHTIFEAALLVVVVVMAFLQSWRASIIPILAIPVSLIGTFAVMAVLGFSLNNLSLFGLVLAIGIVVDDAIVVVEGVERNLAEGLAPRDATIKTMEEVGGALVAIALVLSAVFIPTAFISGISGQFYRQFALTIAVATLFSCFVSLTLSPALCRVLLQPHGAKTGLVCPGVGFLARLVLSPVQSRLRRGISALRRSRFCCHAPQCHCAYPLRRLARAYGVWFYESPRRIHSGPGPRLLHRRHPTAGGRFAFPDGQGPSEDHGPCPRGGRRECRGGLCGL